MDREGESVSEDAACEILCEGLGFDSRRWKCFATRRVCVCCCMCAVGCLWGREEAKVDTGRVSRKHFTLGSDLQR